MTTTHPSPIPGLPMADLADPALTGFLLARIAEETVAARSRLTTVTGEPAHLLQRGLELLDELAASLREGRSIDQMSVDLLVAAHGRHPEFRRAWDRFAA